MANPELSQRIQELPEELLGLERELGIVERLRRIDALKDRARALDPLDGVEGMALADYDRDWLVRYTYNSNAIEGSTLTLEDTSLVLEGEFVPSDSPARYVFAARGVADGMAYVREYAREGRRLDEELVRRVHEVTALDLQPFARGTFRPYGFVFLDCVEQEEHAFIELVEGLRRKPDAIRSKTDLLDRFGDTLRQNLARQDGDGKSAGIDHEGPGCHMSH